MNSTSTRTVAALALGATLALGACSAGDDASTDDPTTTTVGSTTTVDTTDQTADRADDDAAEAPDGDLAVALANIDAGYRSSEGVWDGFVPNEHPVVLAWQDDTGAVTGAVAINHRDPDALGDATAIDSSGFVFDSVHRIDNLADDAAETLGRVQAFEFNTVVGGVDSFLMIAGGGDPFFEPTTLDYTSTLLHELFHRYQFEAFPLGGSQDVEGYAYTAENIELAALEDRALAAAVQADDAAGREAAARHFAAIRLARLAADGRVVLDTDQEIGEGTARYLEHRLAGDNTGYAYHGGNYDSELFPEPTGIGGVKDHYGFGRWYATGAAGLHLLDELGVEGVAARVEEGEGPAAILAAELEVAEADVDALVAEARERYDPLGELPALAADAAEQAAGEGPVFGDAPIGEDGGADGPGGAPGGDDEGEEIEITDEQFQCLVDNGFDPDAGGAISDEVWDACFG